MLDYVIIVASIALAGFYSGAETGFYCVNRLRLRLRAERSHAAARSLQHLVSHPRLAIGTMLVGTNIGIYLATVMCTEKLRTAGWTARPALYSSLLMPPILLIFAEIIPKSLFQHHADALMYRAILPLRVSGTVFYPLSLLLRWLSALPQAILGKKGTARRPVVTPDSFRFHFSEGAAQGALSAFQKTMAENILQLRSVDVVSAMTPLEEAVMIAEDAPYEELLDLLRQHRYSRIPVYRGSRSRVVGITNVIDVASAEGQPALRDVTRGVLRLNKGTSVADALVTLRQGRQQFAVVSDEAGSAVGVITVKDLVEEIVGELEAW